MEEGRREKGRLLPTDNRHRLFLWSLERREEEEDWRGVHWME